MCAVTHSEVLAFSTTYRLKKKFNVMYAKVSHVSRLAVVSCLKIPVFN